MEVYIKKSLSIAVGTVALLAAGMPLAQGAKAPEWNPSPAAVQSGSCAAGRPGGTGLGLTIARSVAEAHGGSLSLSNRPEGGIEARLTLPRAWAGAAGLEVDLHQ